MRVTCLEMVYELAQRDSRVVFVGSDLSPGLLADMRREMPDRWYMEGVAEANLIGMASGLAMDGYLPYVNTIATFITRRCFEQVAIDLCLHDLPARLIGNGGGLVYAPLGPTHLATEDLAIMRTLPNMTVTAACDADEMRRLMEASLTWPHPLYIRLAKGGDPIVSRPEGGFTLGRAIPMLQAAEPGAIVVMSTGIMTTTALAAARIFESEGVPVSVVHFHTVKPLDVEMVLDFASRARMVVTLEEGTVLGGFGSAVGETLIDSLAGAMPKLLRLGLPDRFPETYGVQDDLLRHYGLLPEQIATTVLKTLAESPSR